MNADPDFKLGRSLGKAEFTNLACHAIGLNSNPFSLSCTADGTNPAIESKTITSIPALISSLIVPKASSPLVG